MKNCLIVFRNKRINLFDGANGIIAAFADCGYWFDKISFVAFDSAEEIVKALKEGKESYFNTVILCPHEMEKTLKKYLSGLYLSEFDGFGILKSAQGNAFILYSDCANKLTVEDICAVYDKQNGEKSYRAYIKTVGAPAALISSAIEKASAVCGDLNFNVTDSYGDCTIEVIYGESVPKKTFDSVHRGIVGALNDYIYALENISLAERLVQLLKLRRMKICVAESFTGGGICKRLVEVSGASEVFYEGLNTYSNEAKADRLGVKEMTLKHFGAVSKETAYEMAEGLINQGNCDVSIATTGIAGPKSDNTLKPVGLNYIAVGTLDGISVHKYNFGGTRKNVTETAINVALYLAFKAVK